MIIWDRGRYETVKWTDDEVEVVLHGERVDGGYVFFRAHDEDERNWLVRRKLGSNKGVTDDPPTQTKITVRVEDRQLRLTNMEKVLYPADGFSKAEVIDYYRQIAPVLLPHLADRPTTFKRYPDGVDSASFFEKDVSRHAPDWVRTMRLETPNSTKGTRHRRLSDDRRPAHVDLGGEPGRHRTARSTVEGRRSGAPSTRRT